MDPFRSGDQRSVYSHGSAALDPLGVLGSPAYLYPAEVTGAAGPRIPFATGNDRVDNACDRWELQATGVPIPTLMVYGQEMEPIPFPTTVPCTDMSIVQITGGVATSATRRGLLVVFVNQSTASCAISGYPVVSLLDSAQQVVPVKIGNGSGFNFQDPGATPITVAPSGHVSLGVTIGLDSSGKCSTPALMRVTLPGQKKATPLPVDISPCQVSDMTVTALVAGGMGPPRS
jgi:hypothetical protein